MARQLVNVRLDPDRVRKAQALRAAGVSLSEVVREAIDARFATVNRALAARDVQRILSRILQEYPDPPDLPKRTYDVHEGTAARKAIRAALRRGRR